MEQYEKDRFIKATKEKVNSPIYRVEYNGKNLIYTIVNQIPEIIEFIDSSFDIPLGDNLYFGYSVLKDLTTNGFFQNRAVLCEDGSYYIYNEHSFLPEYVKLVSAESFNDFSGDDYPENINECVEVIVNE